MHPVIFRIFGFPIHSYGLMLALAFLFGIYLLGRQAKEFGDSPDHASNIAIWVLIPAMIGARLFHCFVFWEHYSHNLLAIINVREGGLVFYGGLIGGALGGLAYLKRAGLDMAAYTDFVAPTIAAGLGITRLGCLMAGCCHGKTCPADFPLGITFPSESAGISGIPLYPTQPAESFFSFLIFLLLWFVVRRRKYFHGQVMATFLIAYGVIRSTLEFFRNDPRGFLGLFTVHGSPGMTWENAGGLWKAFLYTETLVEKSAGSYTVQLSESQAVSIVMFVIAALMFIFLPAHHPATKMSLAPAAAPSPGPAEKKRGKKRR